MPPICLSIALSFHPLQQEGIPEEPSSSLPRGRPQRASGKVPQCRDAPWGVSLGGAIDSASPSAPRARRGMRTGLPASETPHGSSLHWGRDLHPASLQAHLGGSLSQPRRGDGMVPEQYRQRVREEIYRLNAIFVAAFRDTPLPTRRRPRPVPARERVQFTNRAGGSRNLSSG